MFDLQWLAFRADITRVVTFMLGRELNFRTYPEIGITEGHHGLSHHQDNPTQLAKYAKLGTYQAELFAWFLDKLQATPDGDGTLLDHSLFLYGAGLSNPNLHAHYDLPLRSSAARPALKGGRHLRVPAGDADDEPAADDARQGRASRPETLGDSTGRLADRAAVGSLRLMPWIQRRTERCVSETARSCRVALLLDAVAMPASAETSLARRGEGAATRRPCGRCSRKKADANAAEPTARRRCTGRCSATTAAIDGLAAARRREGAGRESLRRDAALRWPAPNGNARAHRRGCSRPAPTRTPRCRTARRR